MGFDARRREGGGGAIAGINESSTSSSTGRDGMEETAMLVDGISGSRRHRDDHT